MTNINLNTKLFKFYDNINSNLFMYNDIMNIDYFDILKCRNHNDLKSIILYQYNEKTFEKCNNIHNILYYHYLLISYVNNNNIDNTIFKLDNYSLLDNIRIKLRLMYALPIENNYMM